MVCMRPGFALPTGLAKSGKATDVAAPFVWLAPQDAIIVTEVSVRLADVEGDRSGEAHLRWCIDDECIGFRPPSQWGALVPEQ